MRQFRTEVPATGAHVLQSAGTLAFNDTPHEIVRTGIMLRHFAAGGIPEASAPVMTRKTRIALIRDVPAELGSLPRIYHAARDAGGHVVGSYADGYPRHASNRDAAMLVRETLSVAGPGDDGLMVIDVSQVRTRHRR
jgi:alanine racemase